jgi:Fe-S-cluster containining protein
MKGFVSKCCEAPNLIIEQSDEGTGFYRCRNCGDACDFKRNKNKINDFEMKK